MWYDERKFYDFNTKSCSRICGHYTQVCVLQSQILLILTYAYFNHKTNFQHFPQSLSVWKIYLDLEDIFNGNRILCSKFFFIILLHYQLTCTVSSKKSAVILLFILLYVMCLDIPDCLKIFPLLQVSSNFKNFQFSSCLLCCSLLSFLALQVYGLN